MLTLTINKACKLHLAADKELGRYAYHGVRVDHFPDGTPRAVATNGRILAMVPLEPDDFSEELPEGTDFIVPRDAWKEACMGKAGWGATKDRGSLTWNGNGAVTGSRAPGRELGMATIEGEFPKVDVIEESYGDVTHTVTLSAHHLRDLADALGAEDGQVTLEIEDPNKAILVTVHGSEARGYIMPVVRRVG